MNIPSDIGSRATPNDRIGHFVGFTPRALLWSPTSAPRPSSRAPSQVEVAKLTNRLMWLSDEAYSHGWTLLARYRDARITYVLADEHGETEFDTLDEVEQEMRSMCRIRKLPPMRDL